MKRIARVHSLLLLVACSALIHAGEVEKPDKLKWARRAGAIAVCGAEALDTTTTFYRASQYGAGHAYETSAALRGANGDPSPWKFALLKGGICAGAVLMSRSRGLVGQIGLGVAPVLVIQPLIGSAHNMRLQPGTPSPAAVHSERREGSQ